MPVDRNRRISIAEIVDEARAKGKVRQEGNDYVMVDRDVVELKCNV